MPSGSAIPVGLGLGLGDGLEEAIGVGFEVGEVESEPQETSAVATSEQARTATQRASCAGLRQSCKVSSALG